MSADQSQVVTALAKERGFANQPRNDPVRRAQVLRVGEAVIGSLAPADRVAVASLLDLENPKPGIAGDPQAVYAISGLENQPEVVVAAGYRELPLTLESPVNFRQQDGLDGIRERIFAHESIHLRTQRTEQCRFRLGERLQTAKQQHP